MASTGEMNAKLEPRYDGIRPLVMNRYSSVPIPFINRQVVGLTLNKNGTSTVEPNIANRCWILSGMFSARGGRSSTWMILFSMHITSFLFFKPIIF